MRLPPGSRALRRRSSLPHSVARRAPRDEIVGLRNPVSCDPVRERGDKVFVERQHATTAFLFNTDSDDYFPDDDFFPDVDVLFGNMSSSASVSYVILFRLFEIMLQTLPLATCVELVFAYFLLHYMTSLPPIILAMFYLLHIWIKSCGKLLIFSTMSEPPWLPPGSDGSFAGIRDRAIARYKEKNKRSK